MLGWLNENQGAVLGLLTFVLVAVTAYYAWVNRQLLALTQRQHRDATLPVVGFRIPGRAGTASPGTQGEGNVPIEARNAGAGPALDLRFAFSGSGEVNCEAAFPPQPLALAGGDGVEVIIRVDPIRAFMTGQLAEAHKRIVTLGTLTATYRDIHGRPVSSCLAVEWAEPPLGMQLGVMVYAPPAFPPRSAANPAPATTSAIKADGRSAPRQ
ncbi:MAG: hypothetical protein M3Q71_05725 [Chloroflexota bacterium]|nr:hypothetical protein [Chloroflexota bacterium]